MSGSDGNGSQVSTRLLVLDILPLHFLVSTEADCNGMKKDLPPHGIFLGGEYNDDEG